MRRHLEEARAAMGGTWLTGAGVGDPATGVFEGAAIDSRHLRGQELFFALAGEHTNGHRFVAQALGAGAAAAVVSEPDLAPPHGAILIRVEDTLRALHDLTREVRRQVPRQLVGLTGSAGKTTTKELLAAMLAKRYRVAKSPGNLNNLLGFPLALLSIPDDTEWMVAEMGMSTPGELAGVSRLARPDVAILLNVKPVHLENFGTLRAIAEAKAEILAGLPASGILVANADDPEVVRVAARHPGRIVWFGSGESAEVRLASAVSELPTGGSRFELATPAGTVTIELALHGAYNARNFLAAAACAVTLDVALSDLAAAALEARPAAGRGEVRELPDGITLIDDSYNSNPEALAEALASAARRPATRRWAVLGEMLELGPTEGEFHRQAGHLAAELGFAPVVGVGALATELAAAAGPAGRWYATAQEAAAALEGELAAGDLVLVKGSRGVGLERVVAELTRVAGGRN